MKAINLRKMVIEVVIICIASGYVRADKLQLQEKLSRDAKIQLNDVTIAQALNKIGETAEVKIVLSDEAVWKLPYGEATRLSVALSGPLADSLTEMLNAFFMRYAVGDEEITVYPRPELEHILGRPTTKQLELLKTIYTSPIRAYFVEELQKTINEALGQEVLVSPVHVHAQLSNLLGQLVGKEGIYSRTPDMPMVMKKAREPEPNEPEPTVYNLPTPVTLVQLLSQVVIENERERGEPGNTRWYISGSAFPAQIPEIRVVSVLEFQAAKLDQVVDVSFKDESADVILQRLAGWAGMELLVSKSDPSWLEEPIVVDMQNIKLKQALRNIVSSIDGVMDIEFVVNYVRIQGPIHSQKPAVPRKSPSSRDAGEGYVGKISIPMEGGKYYIEFMLRESDLTEELKKLREDKIKEIFEKVSKADNITSEIAARPQPYTILN
ncbi:MAG: hypothetical protein WAV28_07385 [Sedimentisphaerales bacterium]|jgi:hypothetical protein